MTFIKHYAKVCAVVAICFSAGLAAVVACDDVGIVCAPNQPCFALADGDILFGSEDPCGLCALGTFDCAAQTCLGSVQPAAEVCDGADNDCDCEVDEDLVLAAGDPGNDCVPGIGVCADAVSVCDNGVRRCLGQPRPEECNGLDDDCNGYIDDVIAVFSYSGPQEALAFPPCRPRVEVCVDGVPRVTEEILPMGTDLCGNDVDDDCDGRVDEPDTPVGVRSLLLAVDASGSMEDDQQRLAAAFCSFANNGTTETLVKTVVIGARTQVGYPWVEVAHDWASATEACAFLSTGFTSGQAFEYALDGIMLGSIGWPSGDRAAVILTDERLQIGEAIAPEVRVECVLEAFEVFVFTPPSYFSDWAPIVAECGGLVAPLDGDDMTDRLSDWAEPQCL